MKNLYPSTLPKQLTSQFSLVQNSHDDSKEEINHRSEAKQNGNKKEVLKQKGKKKRLFNLLRDFASPLQISHLYFLLPKSALPQLCQSAQLRTKQRSGSSRNLAGPLRKTHSFLSAVMTVRLHLFLDRRLKLI